MLQTSSLQSYICDMDNLYRMRKEYAAGSLKKEELDPDPLKLFNRWLEEAIQAGLREPNAMTLATADADAKPSARMMLLKEVNNMGFVFFTNYLSRKGKELSENRFASLLFDWHIIERQVRIEGVVEKISEAESDQYFDSRPRATKIGAWSSPQSSPVSNRDLLERLEKEMLARFNNIPVHRPPHWGGYIVHPTMIEFWQGRLNRMHDRIAYHKQPDGWSMERLAP